jgi:hypothetical protein
MRRVNLKKSRRTTIISVASMLSVGVLCAASQAQAQDSAQQFFLGSTQMVGKTVAPSMSTASVSDEFDCPLFSNSPYSDILKSINSLESAIQLFPTCKEDASLKNSIQLGKMLKDRVTTIRQGVEGGKAMLTPQGLDEILSQSAQFQELLVSMSQSAEPCYRDPNNRNLLFRINDALQSISPMALDIVTKIPGAQSTLLPIVAGSGALVQSISTLEKVMAESATLDVSNTKQGSENRIALIKNTCQFMKVYNKFEILQMDRAERSRKIQTDYQNQLRPIQETQSSLLEIINSQKPNTTPETQFIAQFKVLSAKMKKSFETARTEYSSTTSEVALCATSKTLASLVREAQFLAHFQKLARVTRQLDMVSFKLNRFLEFQNRVIVQQRDTKACAQDTKDWITAVGDLISESEKMISIFEKSNSQSLSYILAVDNLSAQYSKAKGIQENQKKIEKFTEISVFEPSELTKRIRTMPRYLFSGPETGISGMVPNGPWRAYLTKNGPVFDFLKNNESQFTDIMNVFHKNFDVIMKSEEARISRIVPRFDRSSDIMKYYLLRDQARLNLQTLSLQNFPFGSPRHHEICDRLKIAVRSYQEAKDMLASSHYMCRMIDPILKEEGVSAPLKSYCRNPNGYQGFVEDLQKKKLNQIFLTLMDRRGDLECE